MIRIVEKRNEYDECIGFHISGHASFAKKGQDIVCAAVSILVINCINSIETYTDTGFKTLEDEKTGTIDYLLTDNPVSAEAKLLLDSLFLGLNMIQKEYGAKYVTISNTQGGAKP